MAINHAFPHGHLGYLNDEQESVLRNFRELLLAKSLISQSSTQGNLPIHNDVSLLRYLRARQFFLEPAIEQFKNTEQWRKTNDVDDVYMNIDINEFEEARRRFTQFVGRRDKRGIPVYLFDVGTLNTQAMNKYVRSTTKNLSPSMTGLVAVYEHFTCWQIPLSTVLRDRKDPQVPITQMNNIVDMSGVGLRQFWSLMSYMQDVINVVTNHYPETLDHVFVVGAPSFFPMIWSFVKGLIDPITASKVVILSEAQKLSTLSQYIEPENIPRKYGGWLDFNFGDLPAIEPAIAERLRWIDHVDATHAIGENLRRWPDGPLKWLPREDGDWDLLAVGSVGNKPRRQIVATLKVGNEIGGWADKSMPLPQQHQQTEREVNG